MTRIKNFKNTAKELLEEAKASAADGSFAYKLAAQSFTNHIDELEQLALAEDTSSLYETLDLRLKASHLRDGRAPLGLVSNIAKKTQKTIEYTALRLIKGGFGKSRIPKYLVSELDLRLSAIIPGSSRFVITANTHRDLLGDSLSKNSFERIFAVLESMGKGESFLDAVTTLGPSGAKSLRELLSVIKSEHAEAELTWKYQGEDTRIWDGSSASIDAVKHALELTRITEQNKTFLSGHVELLSKREKIELRQEDGSLVKILFPKAMLEQVTRLHIEQKVRLFCQVTETSNPLTNESKVSYELLNID